MRLTRRRRIVLIVIAVAVILAVNAYFNYQYIRNYLTYSTFYNPFEKAAKKEGIPIVKAT